ncbi:MAG: hypothetical protein PHU79_09605, partial [Oscillospiraceae bacterium]|nr:hypothetical protein [Oscillospiraceae bacterium]
PAAHLTKKAGFTGNGTPDAGRQKIPEGMADWKNQREFLKKLWDTAFYVAESLKVFNKHGNMHEESGVQRCNA